MALNSSFLLISNVQNSTVLISTVLISNGVISSLREGGVISKCGAPPQGHVFFGLRFKTRQVRVKKRLRFFPPPFPPKNIHGRDFAVFLLKSRNENHVRAWKGGPPAAGGWQQEMRHPPARGAGLAGCRELPGIDDSSMSHR